MFFEYVAWHTGIVVAALFLVVGMGIAPRSGSILRVFIVSVGYSAVVGLVDAMTGVTLLDVPFWAERRRVQLAASAGSSPEQMGLATVGAIHSTDVPSDP